MFSESEEREQLLMCARSSMWLSDRVNVIVDKIKRNPKLLKRYTSQLRHLEQKIVLEQKILETSF